MSEHNYKVYDVRVELHDMAVKLERIQYIVSKHNAVDADMTQERIEETVALMKSADQIIYELRQKLFDLQK